MGLLDIFLVNGGPHHHRQSSNLTILIVTIRVIGTAFIDRMGTEVFTDVTKTRGGD